MSQSINPYQSPAPVSPSYDSAMAGSGALTERSIELLRATRPWVRFLSILGFIVALLMILGGLVLTVIGSPGILEMAIGFIVYVLLGVLYLVGALFLFRYATCIRELETARSTHALEEALDAQKKFWRFLGILMAVVLGIYAVMLGVAVLVSVGAMFFGFDPG